MRLVLPRWVRGVVDLRSGDVDAAERAFRECLTYRDRPSALRHRAHALWGLACASTARGRIGDAAAGHVEALELRRLMGDSLQLAESLIGIAAVAAAVAPVEAAGLLGAVPALLTAAGASPTPRLSVDLDVVLSTAEEAGDPAGVARAHQDGATVQPEDAVATAARLAGRLAAGGTHGN
jgi:hypothetical protein